MGETLQGMVVWSYISVSGTVALNLHSHHQVLAATPIRKLTEDKHDQLGLFVEDVIDPSLVVLLVRWPRGQDGIRPVSPVRFVMSCWNM